MKDLIAYIKKLRKAYKGESDLLDLVEDKAKELEVFQWGVLTRTTPQEVFIVRAKTHDEAGFKMQQNFMARGVAAPNLYIFPLGDYDVNTIPVSNGKN